MGTYIVGTILIGMVVVIIKSMIKNRKSGKCSGCSCDCGNCKGI